jgi:hypothetical protein
MQVGTADSAGKHTEQEVPCDEVWAWDFFDTQSGSAG